MYSQSFVYQCFAQNSTKRRHMMANSASYFSSSPSSGYLSDEDSLQGSPPESAAPSWPEVHVVSLPQERKISQTAKVKLAAAKILSCGPEIAKDAAVCEALREFDPENDIVAIIMGKTITNKALKIILPYTPNLQTLDLSGCRLIDEKALKAIAELRHLTELNLSSTDVKILDALNAKPLPFLRKVDFKLTPLRPTAILAFLLKHHITHLATSLNPPPHFLKQFNSSILEELSVHFDTLKNTLSLEEILEFLRAAPSMKNLYVWIETRVDTTAVINFLIACQNLKKDTTLRTEEGTVTLTPNRYLFNPHPTSSQE